MRRLDAAAFALFVPFCIIPAEDTGDNEELTFSPSVLLLLLVLLLFMLYPFLWWWSGRRARALCVRMRMCALCSDAASYLTPGISAAIRRIFRSSFSAEEEEDDDDDDDEGEERGEEVEVEEVLRAV